MRKSAIALLVAGVVAAPALANDTTAELATGGLIFVRNDNVEMRSEDLLISAKEVSVRYRFFNTSDKAVTVLVAFPLPEIRIEEPDQNIAVPTEDPVNFLAFATTVNGAPVETEVEQRVTAAGIDRTQLLRTLGIPLAPHLQSTNEALDRLPKDKWDELIRIGVALVDDEAELLDRSRPVGAGAQHVVDALLAVARAGLAPARRSCARDRGQEFAVEAIFLLVLLVPGLVD